MNAAPNLTTLARVKTWLNITSADSDVQLSQLISAASRFVYQYISLASVVVQAYSERRDGYGSSWIAPRNWPLLSVESIQFAGFDLTAPSTGNPPGAGYTITNYQYGPDRITLHAYCFPKGKDQIVLNYTAGFQQIDQLTILPVEGGQPPSIIAGTIDLTALWAADGGVFDTDTLTPYVKVALSPVSGEYAVDAAGVYQFHSSDVGKNVTVTYSFIPADLAQATTELIGGIYKIKDRIGLKSKSLGGQETIAYFQETMTPTIAMMLQPFVKVTPS